jgi:hypothetical protein
MTSVSCDDDFGVPDAEYWCFLDESGTPDYDPDSKPYFAFGSAVFEGDHGDEYMKVLRARASRTGVQGGFHASHDSNDTKQCFFECIGGMDVKFNAHSWPSSAPTHMSRPGGTCGCTNGRCTPTPGRW